MDLLLKPLRACRTRSYGWMKSPWASRTGRHFGTRSAEPEWRCSFQERYPVGLIEIDHDWPAYRASWSQGTPSQHGAPLPAACGPAANCDSQIHSDISGPRKWNRNCGAGFEIEES